MKQLEPKDVRETRERLLEEQEGFCTLCETYIQLGDAHLDHSHQTGRIRGVLCSSCNKTEGILRSKFIRSGIHKKIKFETYLKNLAEYLTKEHHKIYHPSNRPGSKKLMKSSYNKLIREINKANVYYKSKGKKVIKIPQYPKSKKLTKRLDELFKEFGLNPEYYLK